MERLKHITEFVVISNLENRALNTGINKAQKWWKSRKDEDEPTRDSATAASAVVTEPKVVPQQSSVPLLGAVGQILITILRGKDLPESRLATIGASASLSIDNERPFVIIECNQQRFQTLQAESYSSPQNPQWTTYNGPFAFNVYDVHQDRLMVWVQKANPVALVKRKEPKTIGTCHIQIQQVLTDEQEVWIPLRKDNKPVGQILIRVEFRSNEKLTSSFDKVL